MLLHNFLLSNSFIPHGHCYLWKPELVWLHLISDSLIALAYYSIPLTLFYFVRKRQDLPFHWIFLLFAAFIIACGTTHAIAVWTIWHPTYWLSGAIKAMTAIASLYAAVLFVSLIPQLLALPSPAQLKAANRELQQQIAERLQVEAALRESESRYSTLARVSPVGIFRTDAQGQCLYVNERWCEIAGLSTAEALGEGWVQAIHPDDRDRVFTEWNQAAQSERMFQSEYRFQRPDGVTTWVFGQAVAVANNVVEITGFIGVITDITRRKQIEEALQYSEAQLRLTLEATHIGTWDWNLLANDVKWNENHAWLLGLVPGTFEVSYEAFRVRVHPEDLEGVETAVADALKTKTNYMREYRIIWPDGSLHWIEGRGRCFYDETGNPVRMIGTVMDISDRKLAETALRNAYDELENRVRERTAELLVTNATLQTEIAERQWAERGLSVQYATTRVLAESTTLAEMPPKILPAICENLGWDWAEFWIASRTIGSSVMANGQETEFSLPQVLHCAEIWHAPSIQSSELQRITQTITFEVGVGLPGRVWATGEPTWMEDVVKEENFIRGAIAKEVGLHSAFAFPILMGREILGVITCFSRTQQPPDPELLDIMTAIGKQIGQFVKRKRVEEKLQQTAVLQNAILNSANYTIISTTVDGTILTFNAAAQRMLGYAAAEVIGKTTPAIIHDSEEVMQRSQQLTQELGIVIEPGFEVFVAKARRGEIDEREWTYIRKDGSRFPVLLSVTALRDIENNVTGFLGIGSDITQQKQAEAALKRYADEIADLYNHAPCGYHSLDANGTFIRINDTELNMLGYTREEIVGNKKVTDLITAESLVTFQENFPIFKQQGWVRDLEFQMIRKDGSILPVLLNATAIKDEAGNFLMSRSTMVDISERKRAEEELRTLNKALEIAVVGIAQIDVEGRYVKVNPAYASLVGYQPEEMIGMEWQRTIHPDDRETAIAAYQQMLVNEREELEIQGVRKDGSVFDKKVVMVKAYNQQQQFTGHYRFTKDISDRREIERLKDEFVSVVSHELRTPLTSIAGALDLLASGLLQTQPEEAQRMLSIAANNTDRLVRLINDILDIERIKSGKIAMIKQPCNADDLMTEAVEGVEEMAKAAGITLSVSPLSARLLADPDRIIQVLTNLLSNAIKFSPPDSTIWLSAEIQALEEQVGLEQEADTFSPAHPLTRSPANQKQILFQVKDQGRGIPADKLQSIFEPFQQVDASDSRQKGGTGLGLAICRSILQHHEGQIWVESTVGEGSTFYFTLPALPEAPTTEPSTFCNPNAPLVLVCDDDADLRTVVQSMLEQQGYRVITVPSGQEAVQQSATHHPDAIFLNLMMPGMDGWETLTLLKQQASTQTIPVIILSGLLPDARETNYPGVNDWIVKPPNQELLSQALQKALAKHNQTLKVLVVEDDLDLAQVLIAMFDRHGIETFYAQTGRQAIQLSQRLVPDLLILDLGLPEFDGFAVVDWLRHHNRLCQVPLVVYTALDLAQSDRDRLNLGETLFFTKGRISPQEFEQRVINLLNRIIPFQE